MCGINGVIDLQRSIDPVVFRGQTDLLSHRGPDDGGVWISRNQQYALGFRRLSIIDTGEQAMQPIKNEDGSLHLVCNGEIYNYQELKQILIENGHVFSSTSDTEVILHGYEEWGLDVFSKLNGMFALAIVDENTGNVILARDRFGIKPLYYQINKTGISFSSELRPIVSQKKPKINKNSLVNFLIYRYIPVPDTIYEDTYKLPPARFMIIDPRLNVSITEYWSLNADDKKEDEAVFSQRISEMLKRSVKEHLLSAVPVGAFLSGGYDSTYLALQMKKSGLDPMTFTMGFEHWDQSEDVFAKEVADYIGLKNTIGKINQDDFLNQEIISAWDEPIADISIIPTFYVTKLASKSHKVVLSGDGADELLGGYNWYYDVARQMQDQKKSFFARPKFHKQALETYCRYTAMGLFDRGFLKETLHTDYHRSIPDDVFWLYKQHFDTSVPVIKALQLLDIRTFMPELILPKMDRASMAHSLEVRPAFLDHRIADEIFSHDSSLYFDPKQYKKILFNTLKGEIPASILERKKQGFTGPDTYYDRPDFYRNLFRNSRLIEEGIINRGAIDRFITEKMPWHLWKLAVLEMWFSKFAS